MEEQPSHAGPGSRARPPGPKPWAKESAVCETEWMNAAMARARKKMEWRGRMDVDWSLGRTGETTISADQRRT